MGEESSMDDVGNWEFFICREISYMKHENKVVTENTPINTHVGIFRWQ